MKHDNNILGSPEITGQLVMSFVWSESLNSDILGSCELQGGDIIGISHELIADRLPYILVETPQGFQVNGYKLNYLGEHPRLGWCSLYKVVSLQEN